MVAAEQVTAPIRLFVGTAANDEDLEAQLVYEYSLRKHTEREVELHWLKLSRDPESFWFSDPQKKLGWNARKWRTPFTVLRWGIPAFCGFRGKAIYTDCDMIWLDDIGKLHDQPLESGKAVLAKNGSLFCTMVMDCAALKPILPPIERLRVDYGAYEEVRAILKSNQNLVQKFEGNWNCRDGENYSTIKDPDVKIIHYTRIPTQPTHRHAKKRLKKEGRKHWYSKPSFPHPRPEITKLFDAHFAAAQAAGYRLKKYRDKIPFGEYRV